MKNKLIRLSKKVDIDDDIREKIKESISMLEITQDQISASFNANNFISKADTFPLDEIHKIKFYVSRVKNKIFIGKCIPLMKNIKYKYVRGNSRNDTIHKFYIQNETGRKVIIGIPALIRFLKARDPRFGSFICEIHDMIVQSVDDQLRYKRQYWKEKGFKALEHHIIQDVKTKSHTLYSTSLPKEKELLDKIFEDRYVNYTEEWNLNNDQPKTNQFHFQPTKKFTEAETNFIEHFQNLNVNMKDKLIRLSKKVDIDDDIREKIKESISMLEITQDQISASFNANNFISKADTFPLDEIHKIKFYVSRVKNKIFIGKCIPLMKNIKYKYVRGNSRNDTIHKFYIQNETGRKVIIGIPALIRFLKARDPRFGSFICEIHDMIVQSVDDQLRYKRQYWKEKGFKALEHHIIQDVKTKSHTLYSTSLPKEKELLDKIFEDRYVNYTEEWNLNNDQPKTNQFHFQPTKKFTEAETNFIEHFQNCFIDGFLGFIDDGVSCDDVLCQILECNLNDLNNRFEMDEDVELSHYKMIDVDYKFDIADDIWKALVSSFY